MRRTPNIVVILADDMGYGDVACYNAESKTPTPHLDRLAREGTQFTDAHSGCALCSPTRYGIMTGTHMWRTPKQHALYMPYDRSTMPMGELTLASLLKQRGYRTGLVGKWHLGMNYQLKPGAMQQEMVVENHIDFTQPIDRGPLDFGFDYFFGSAGCSTSDPPYAYIEDRHTVGIPTAQSPHEWNVQPGFYPGLVADGWQIEEVDMTFTANPDYSPLN